MMSGGIGVDGKGGERNSRRGAHDMSREEQLVFAEDWFGRSGCLLAVTEIDPKLPLML